MKTKRGNSRSGSVKIAPKSSRKLTPKVVVPLITQVFEGTIGGRKFLLDASTSTLKVLADITGNSPKVYADAHNMRIVNRSLAHPEAVRTLKKSWNSAKVDEYRALAEQAKLKREATKEKRRTTRHKH